MSKDIHNGRYVLMFDEHTFFVWDNEKDERMTALNVTKKLNEQQATIELLTKRRDKWRELSNSFSAYCKCYEKAIERAFEEKPYPSEEDIYRIYAELEKELENE